MICTATSPSFFGPLLAISRDFLAPRHPAHGVRCALLSAHVWRALIRACNPMLRPCHVSNMTAMGGFYGWLLWVVAMGGC